MKRPIWIVVMRDNRITTKNSADLLSVSLHKPLFIFKSGNARAVYLFGKLIYSRGWDNG